MRLCARASIAFHHLLTPSIPFGRYFGGVSLGEIGAAFARLDADGSGDLTWKE